MGRASQVSPPTVRRASGLPPKIEEVKQGPLSPRSCGEQKGGSLSSQPWAQCPQVAVDAPGGTPILLGVLPSLLVQMAVGE